MRDFEQPKRIFNLSGSLALTIPVSMVRWLGIEAGETVVVSCQNEDTLVIRRLHGGQKKQGIRQTG